MPPADTAFSRRDAIVRRAYDLVTRLDAARLARALAHLDDHEIVRLVDVLEHAERED